LNVKVKGQGHWGQKNEKARLLFGSHPLGRGPRASMPVGKSAHAVVVLLLLSLISFSWFTKMYFWFTAK